MSSTPLSPSSPPYVQPGQSRVAVILLAVLVIFYGVSASAWALADGPCPMWDQARHAWDALRFKAFLADVVHGRIPFWDALVWHDNYYIWLAYLPTALAHAVFGNSFDVAQMVMALGWTPLALVSTWWLVQLLLGSPLAAFVATAWLASSPMMADLSKDYLVDLPILALVALSLALLVKSDYLLHPRWSLAFGAAAGGIVLIKAVAPIVFVVLPVALSMLRAWKTGNLRPWLKGLGAAALGWLITAGPVHLRWYPEFWQAKQWQQNAASMEGDVTDFWPSLLIHVRYLVDLQARGVMLPWMIWGAVRLWKSHRVLVLSCLGTFLFCELAWTVYPNKDVRFCMPDLVFLAVLAGGVAWPLEKEHPRRPWITGGAALVVALFSTWSVQWGFSFLPQQVAPADITLFAQRGYLRGKPDPSPSVPLEVASQIARDPVFASMVRKHRVALLHLDLGQDEAHFSNWAMQHASWSLDHLYEVEDSPDFVDQMDYMVRTRCPGQPFPPTPGYVEIYTTHTPQQCVIKVLRNQRLLDQEQLARTGPQLNVRYRAYLQEHTLVAAYVDAAQVKPGEQHTVTFLVRVEVPRYVRCLTRTLRMGTLPLVTWKTAETRQQRGGEYAHTVTFTVPAEAPPGRHPLVLSITAPQAPAVMVDANNPNVLNEREMVIGYVEVLKEPEQTHPPDQEQVEP